MEKKQCSKCKKWKDLDCFSKCEKNKDGLRYECKECGKEYYEKHKNRELKQKRIYYEKHKEIFVIKNKDYYEENKLEILKEKREYYKSNKPKVLKRGKKHKNSSVKFNSKSKFRKEIELYEEIRESKEGYLQCKCVYCGDWFTPTYLNITHRINSINTENQGECRLYCSESCKQSCPTYKQLLYPKGFKTATSREVQPELRQMVLARDDYTCQRCGKTKDELSEECIALHCHHLEGILWEPLMSADLDMCITYCQPCHVKAHQTPDCSYHDQQCTDIWKENN